MKGFEAASEKEWLLTNGIGGFASGTVSGANTRRYHGLLTAATKPPLGRISMLSKFEETLIIANQRIELSSNKYPGKIFPDGFKYIKDFKLDPFPVWNYEVDGVRLEKRIFMPHGSNTVVCKWTLHDAANTRASLELRPLLSFVDYHHVQHLNGQFKGGFTEFGSTIVMQPYDHLPEIFFSHNASGTAKTGHWYHDLEYAIEKERGFNDREDLYQPFLLRFDPETPAIVIASTESNISVSNADRLERAEVRRCVDLVKVADVKDAFEQQLVLAADQFIVKRGEGSTIIAGYPWFSDWGRDTMIALPGLTLSTGRHDEARDILLEFSNHISYGMLPNRFPDEGETPDYNTVDATLWYFEAVRAYVEASGDKDLVETTLYAKLADIVTLHMRGTRHEIHVDTDGLLYAGESGHQLTWMDAKIGDLVITPRTGKPVEIQALWYNALMIMAEFAETFGHDEDAKRFRSMADLAYLSFNAVFWNDEKQCLFDYIENGNRNDAVRPNQLLAISLDHPILDKKHWLAVVTKAENELLTPVGMRSLSPADPAYVPIYKGSPFDRDSAYHQGTVWGWLIGPYVDAYKKVYDHEPALNAKVASLLTGFEQHLSKTCIGQISEIFDGDAPHHSRGCPAQAWSVAEVLRVYSALKRTSSDQN